MRNVTGLHQLYLIALLSLTGCGNTQVLNSNPDAYFSDCDTINAYDNKAVPDAVITDKVRDTNVNLKLRDRQAPADQVKFGKCAAKKAADAK